MAATPTALAAIARPRPLAPRHRPPGEPVLLAPTARARFIAALRALIDARVPFLVGGAYAFERYTGIARPTKDFDVFVRRRDCLRTLDALTRAGFRTEIPFSHWLAKAYAGEHFVDIIFSSGNGVAKVDDDWFRHAVPAQVLGLPVRLCPPEETIWQKSLVMERERFDGADVAHLLHACAETLDWNRLLRRFGPHWRVLYAHLILFGFIYPGERDRIPARVMADLAQRLAGEVETAEPDPGLCQGTIISREQFLVDIQARGYRDARRKPPCSMSDDEIAVWTEAIESNRVPSP